MSRCTDTNKLSAAGPDAQARSILSPQPPSVRSGVLPPFDSARAGVVPGWAGPNVSGPSAARAGTGTRLAGAVAHEWPSVPTVVGAGSSSQHHPQSPVPIGPDVQAPLDSGHGRPFAGLCVFIGTLQRSDWQRISQRALQKRRNSQNSFIITRLYKRPQRSNENKTRGALLVRRCIVLFVLSV